MNPSPSIVGLSDIEALERVPLEQRDPPSSTYELLQRARPSATASVSP